MDPTTDLQLAKLVAAWHNRHPLARRITPAQVLAMGVVALPFVAAGKKPRRAFSDNFMAPVGPGRVARFGLRHGTAARPGPDDWPQRDVAADPKVAPASAVDRRYLRTAAVDIGHQRTRVLIGNGARPKVLGTRLWSRPRLIGATAAFGAVLLALAAALGRASAPGHDAPLLALASPVAGAAPVSSSASSAASGVVTASPAATPVAASASPLAAPAETASAPPAASASGEAASSAPVGAQASAPSTADKDTPPRDIRPTLSAEQRAAAQQESRQARADKAEKTANPAGAAKAASAGGAASAAANGRVFAVATPATRTRAAAQLRIVLMNAPVDAEPGRPHAEVMQIGEGWRTVVWPFGSREAAERTREGLAARGIPAEVIEF